MSLGPGDPFWYYKVLGLHCDGANNSTTFTDVKGKTVTAAGNAKISTTTYPPLTGKSSSAYLDGAGDYLTIADSADWAFGSGDFSIRCFFKQAATGGTYTLLAQRTTTTSSYSFALQITGSTITFICSTSGTATTHTATVAYTQETSNWHFVEVVRSGTNLIVFIDGTAGTPVSISTSTLFNSAAVLSIGGDTTGSSNQFNGYLSEIEIYKGVAVNTAGYMPPTAPFPDTYVRVSGIVKNASDNFASKLIRLYNKDNGRLAGQVVSDAETGDWSITPKSAGRHVAICLDTSVLPVVDSNLLISMPLNGAHDSTDFYDLVENRTYATAGVSINTAVADPFGGYSGVADFTTQGAAIYIDATAVPQFCAMAIEQPRNYTIAFWIYLKTLNAGAYAEIVAIGTSANTVGLGRNSTANQLSIICNGVGVTLSGGSLPTLNQWVYVEATRSNNTSRIFFNGVQQASGTTIHEYTTAVTTAWIGSTMTGYLCDFQYWNTAKHTANYTAPTSRITQRLVDASLNALIYDNLIPY